MTTEVSRKIEDTLQQFTEIDKNLSINLGKADMVKAKAMEKHSARWSCVGTNKKKAIEALQEVTRDMADSQIEIIRSQINLFENQKALTQQMRVLYQIGAMSIAANRMVHQELKLKLERASREQLSELAKEELRVTIKQLEQMQDQMEIQEKQKERINEHSNQLKQQNSDLIEIQKEIMDLKKAIEDRKSLFDELIEKMPFKYKVLIFLVGVLSILSFFGILILYIG